MRSKIDGFLKELNRLSRKHGVWIETTSDDSVTLVNEDLEIIGIGLYNDADTQEYCVKNY